mmetsp:Transcript_9998/g.20846  ORF Transcript_9998/g.20846 Transcript_9998/m.20846 type:complete len:557 (+) Transcript_9998:229-1899(+)
MMRACDSSVFDEGLQQVPGKESPPFALDDNQEQNHNAFHESISSQQPTKKIEIDNKTVKFAAASCKKDLSVMSSYSQYSSNSAPPELAESTMTDETSCCSTFSSPRSIDTFSSQRSADTTKPIDHEMKMMSSSPSLSHHISGMSSIVSTTSLTSIPLEPRMATFVDPQESFVQTGANSRSIGFSELMKAADNSNTKLDASSPSMLHVSNHRSIGRLPPLPENQEAECGQLISAAPQHRDRIPANAGTDRHQSWWDNVPFLSPGHSIANGELNSPLLSGIIPNDDSFEHLHITRLLSNGSSQEQRLKLALERASTSVQTKIESDDSFEVSLLLGENTCCTVDDVVEVISNVNLLNLWCNPIESLIVTSNSSEGSSLLEETPMNIERENLAGSGNNRDGNERIREYEAEWIEATTSSLESPSSSVSFVLNAGQAVLQSLGCTSYGKITMFIERQRGRISLNVGPFNGGISASHLISVISEDSEGGSRIRIVDRVRLTHENEDESFFLGRLLGCAVGSCLSSCFYSPIVGYVDQVTMSMARLRILLEGRESIRSTGRPM